MVATSTSTTMFTFRQFVIRYGVYVSLALLLIVALVLLGGSRAVRP